MACLGNFSRNEDRNCTLAFPRQYTEVVKHALAKQIVDIVAVDRRYVQVTLSEKEKEEKARRPNRACSASIGALITSRSRIFVHQTMKKITSLGGCMFKVACDALFFSFPQEAVLPISFSQSLGKWKEIYPGCQVLSLVQLGPNSYSISCKDKRSGAVFTNARLPACNSRTFSQEI